VLTSGAVEDIVITSGQTATFTAAQLTGQAISFNASAAGAANLIINCAATGSVSFSTLAFIARSGNAFDTGTDTVTINAGATSSTIVGTSIVDVIVGGAGADAITGGGGADTLTLSGGIDTVTVGTVTAGGIDIITDLVGGTDVIKTGAFATAALALTAVGAVAGADLATALGTFAAGQANATVALNAYTFTHGGNTYLVIDNGTTGYAAGTDSVIQITGVTGTLAAAGIFNAT
jgi:Ca2+-binding RTX toxin-like protein